MVLITQPAQSNRFVMIELTSSTVFLDVQMY